MKKEQEDSGILFQKIRRVMKITVVLILWGIIHVSATTYAQEHRISISVKNGTFYDVVSQIEKQSEFMFFYKSEEIDNDRRIDLKAKNKLVSEVLDEVLKGNSLVYQIIGKHIIITKYVDPTQGKLKVTGVVVDTRGEVIVGANVVEEDTNNGVITDPTGKFALNVRMDAKLRVSFIGYITQLIPVGREPLKITLEEDNKTIDEVVVIGYGTQRKVTLTGSVSTLKGETLQLSPSTNLSNNIVGRITGLIANNRSGEPGSDWSDIFIRGKGTMGNNGPLYVIDGVANRGNFERLNPSDIESITVLKDASAAIYGAQAANGVILVTTKRGGTGKPTISYDGNFGLSQATRMPKLLNAYQYMVYKDEANKYDGLPEYFGEIKDKYLNGSIDGITLADTDWMSIIFRNVAPQTQHSLSVSGGNEQVKYFVSGGYLYQEPLYKSTVGNNYNTVQIRSNIDASITRDLTVSVELGARRENRFNSNYNSDKIFTETFNIYPYVPAYYPNGLPSAGISRGLNPAILTTGVTGYYKNIDKFINTKVGFDLKLPWITNGLSFSGYIAYDTQNGKDKGFTDHWDAYQYTKDQETDEFTFQNIREETNEEGSITLSQSAYDNESTTINLKVGYERKFGSHAISGFIAFEQNKLEAEHIGALRRDFLSGQIQFLSAGADARKDNNGGGSHSSRQNYFSRVEYGFKDKYLASLTLRLDGSSNFPPNKRWGTFPALSLGWRLSEEGFVKKNLPFIDNLKVRASWGKLGNDRVAPYQYLATYGLSEGTLMGNPAVRVKGFIEGVTPNTNITWETIDSKNIALEGNLWNGMLSFDLNYFYADRTGILISRNASVPDFAAISLPDQNLGRVVNRGVEVEVSHRNKIGNVNYYIGGNLTFARNKVVYMDEAADVSDWQKKTGYSLDSWMVFKTDGIYQTEEEVANTPHLHNAQPGDIKYVDVDGDKEITNRDQIRIHKGSTPELVFGIPMGVSWKGINLNILWQGQAMCRQLVLPQNLNIDVAYFRDRWISATETPNAKYPRAYNYEDPINDRAAELWLKEASFLRLKNVELAYNFNSRLLQDWRISNLRVYVNGSNLLCFDGIKILDPEVNRPGGYYYPQTRIYNIGINLTF